MLPVVVKDVAGLVPGAYKGRGKGNRFLADLCDADVLVHVVDVTGQADRDGNAVVSAPIDAQQAPSEDKGSSPMEDAEWIREELHRWIYGNVRAKWNSVLACTRTNKPGAQKLPLGKPPPLATQQQRDRSAQRVLALFTGYQGPRWCVELASERAGLQLEHAGTWTARDLHRMVAHFLSIRFPVCLALNKIDSLDKSDEAQTVIRQCQETARLRGEAAVPVSARAECWILNQMAAAAADTEGLAGNKKAPSAASAALEEALCRDVLHRYGTTGVLEVSYFMSHNHHFVFLIIRLFFIVICK
jgi:ribosome-binding ATPase YchF (GTP1/OBG family)